jgi:hypothetical protein
MTGAPGRQTLVHEAMLALEEMLKPASDETQQDEDQDDGAPPAKKRKMSRSSTETGKNWANTFPASFPTGSSFRPSLRHPIKKISNCTFESFQQYLDSASAGLPSPVILTGTIEHWPARSSRTWENPQYFMDRTLGGRRLVPVETGRSYTDEGWGQKIMTIGKFMRSHMLHLPEDEVIGTDRHAVAAENRGDTASWSQTVYLAQHDLFSQIPALRSDICVPDFCYCTPPRSTGEEKSLDKGSVESDDDDDDDISTSAGNSVEPVLNAWFGPEGTISPLHTDPHHNILAQVVGSKYVRLYAPSQTQYLYPRSEDVDGIDMSNTSEVDLDEAIEIYESTRATHPTTGSVGPRPDPYALHRALVDPEDKRAEFENLFPLFKEARYVECIADAGDCLYIPKGWWHFVRSLSPSFSVSFWWD